MSSQRDDVSRWVSVSLQVGGVISIAIVAVGVVLGMESITRTGLLVVVLTPIGRLAAAGVAFLRNGERRYAAAAGVVLSLLVGGLVVAIAASGGGG